MKSITVQELVAWRKDGVEHMLLDIREPYEREVSHIDGVHIPMEDIVERLADIPEDIPVVVHCRSGARSAAVTHALTQQYGFDNIHNLEGGIRAWAEEIDPNLDVA
ncbi:MAG: rhodanese-like domain-containing protein [Bacteroidetes bacterium]|nr:rhodanese-like domain-containing protein [Bacteroidota bacterium]